MKVAKSTMILAAAVFGALAAWLLFIRRTPLSTVVGWRRRIGQPTPPSAQPRYFAGGTDDLWPYAGIIPRRLPPSPDPFTSIPGFATRTDATGPTNDIMDGTGSWGGLRGGSPGSGRG